MHQKSKHWYLINYVIVRFRDLHEVQITQAMHGAKGSTDHRLIRSTIWLTVRPPARRQKPKHKLNVQAAHNQNIKEELRNAIAHYLSCISMTTTSNCTSDLTMEWQAHSSAQPDALERQHQDLLDDSITDTVLLSMIKMLHTMLICGIQLLALFMSAYPPFVRQ